MRIFFLRAFQLTGVGNEKKKVSKFVWKPVRLQLTVQLQLYRMINEK